jgi:prepilin-type N-terminal cleavage/methylation domain-containing protein
MKAASTALRQHLAARVSCSRGRAGFSLLEMVTVMALYGILLSLLMMTLIGIFHVEQSSRAALDGLGWQAVLADQFRDDVSQALAAPQHWQGHTAGPACLILEMSDKRHVVYLWEDSQLFRLEGGAGGKSRKVPLPGKGKGTVTFSRAGPKERLLTLRMVEPASRPGKESILDVTAAQGGDRR